MPNDNRLIMPRPWPNFGDQEVYRQRHLANLTNTIAETRDGWGDRGKTVSEKEMRLAIDHAKVDDGQIDTEELKVLVTGYKNARMTEGARQMYLKVVLGIDISPDPDPIDVPVALYSATIDDWTARAEAGEVDAETLAGVATAVREAMRPFGGVSGRAAFTTADAGLRGRMAELPDDQQSAAIRRSYRKLTAALRNVG